MEKQCTGMLKHPQHGVLLMKCPDGWMGLGGGEPDAVSTAGHRSAVETPRSYCLCLSGDRVQPEPSHLG